MYTFVHIHLCTHAINNSLFIKKGLTALQPQLRCGPGDGMASLVAPSPHQCCAHTFACALGGQ